MWETFLFEKDWVSHRRGAGDCGSLPPTMRPHFLFVLPKRKSPRPVKRKWRFPAPLRGESSEIGADQTCGPLSGRAIHWKMKNLSAAFVSTAQAKLAVNGRLLRFGPAAATRCEPGSAERSGEIEESQIRQAPTRFRRIFNRGFAVFRYEMFGASRMKADKYPQALTLRRPSPLRSR